jgi:hypothetical protein
MKPLPIAKTPDKLFLIKENKLLKEKLEEAEKTIFMLRYTIERHRQEIQYEREERER